MLACIVTEHEASCAKIVQVLNHEGAESVQKVLFDQAAEMLPLLHPNLVVVALGSNPERGLTVLHEVRLLCHGHIVAVGPDGNTKLVLQAMHMGANDFVSESDMAAELKDAIHRLEAKNLAQSDPGKIIGLLGSSGGSGSSTLAVNIATVLAKKHERCALFDLKLASGDLAPLLDLKPTHNLAELCQNTGRMDRGMFERCLVRHASGVHLMPPPATLDDINFVTPQGVRQALTLARSMFPYVVVDLDHSFREEQLQALRQTTTLLLVLRLDFTSLRNTRNALSFLLRMGIGQERIRVVVNRYGQPKEVPAAKAEEALGCKIHHFVPDEPKTINRANNNGVPAVLESPSSYVSKSVTQLTMSINGQA
jgi:pilus assembly protein CpaE